MIFFQVKSIFTNHFLLTIHSRQEIGFKSHHLSDNQVNKTDMNDDSANKSYALRPKLIPFQTKPTKTGNDSHEFRF